MKALGIIRNVDSHGRIVLPSELRKSFDIDLTDPIEIFTDGDRIILKKYSPQCMFCGEASRSINYKGKNICPQCLSELKGITQN